MKATAVALINVIEGLLRDDEVGVCEQQFVLILRAAFEAYEAQRARLVVLIN